MTINHSVGGVPPALHQKHPLRLDDLAGFRTEMPPLRRPSTELLRETRDEGL